MAKYINVESGDYRIKTAPGGNIFLDTSTYNKVIVTGNLEVHGETTVVQTNDLAIEDNIIQLNKTNSTDTYFPVLEQDEIVSGLEVDLGGDPNNTSEPLPAAQWVYDGSLVFKDPQNDKSRGCWVPKKTNGALLGIQAVSITTPGTDLNLLGVIPAGGGGTSPNPGFVTIKGTENYSGRIADLVGGDIGVSSPFIDDIIPNVAFVNDAITHRLQQTRQPRIQEGTFGEAETYVETQDDTVSGTSQVLVGIDGIVTTTFTGSETRMFDVVVEGNTIRSALEEQDLVLYARTYGSVVVNDSLLLTPTSQHLDGGLLSPDDVVINPSAPTAGIKLYAKPEESGGTGIFFVNDNSTRDEIISKNKAILYSMIF